MLRGLKPNLGFSEAVPTKTLDRDKDGVMCKVRNFWFEVREFLMTMRSVQNPNPQASH